jgi:hypothetical protein
VRVWVWERSGDPPPKSLHVSVFGRRTALLEDGRLANVSLPGDMVISLPPVAQAIRIVVSSDDAASGANIEGGARIISPRAGGQATVSIELSSAAIDLDKDGIPEPFDNCPDAANPNQADADGDGFGDACDKLPHGLRVPSQGYPSQAVGVDAAGHLNYFVLSRAQLVHAAWPDWMTLSPLGDAAIIRRPIVAKNGNAGLLVLGLKGNGGIDVIPELGSNAGWAGTPTAIGGVFDDVPAGVSDMAGQVELFAVGGGGRVYQATPEPTDSTGWSAWSSIGGAPVGAPLVGPPVAGRNPDGSVDVFVLDAAGGIWHAVEQASGWSDWVTIPGPRWADPPALGPRSDGGFDLLARGLDNAAYQSTRSGQQWGPWVSIGGTFTSSLAAALNQNNRMMVFGRWKDDTIWYAEEFIRGWGPWVALQLGSSPTANMTFAGAPSVGPVPQPPSWVLQVFARAAADNHIYSSYFNVDQNMPSNSSFISWFDDTAAPVGP